MTKTPGAEPPEGLEDPSPGIPPIPQADVVVVGSGIAGLSAALELARQRPALTVLLLTRGRVGHGASALAQGGVAAALDPADSPELHALDTRTAADGLARPELVEILTRDGPDRVRDLIRLGARFDRLPSGGLSLGLEGAHSRRRILHAHGDRTGAEVTRALREAVLASPAIRILEGMEAVELHRPGKRVEGVLCRDREGSAHLVRAACTLLATGGPGRAYLRTTAPPGLTGDGLAMAARAGALLRDLEFVQFHPTALNVDADPLPLVTEALRGAGARLVDGRGAPVVDPAEGGELASRDRVARALWTRILEGTPVFLDTLSAVGDRIEEDFPGVYALCRTHGIDPVREPIPVTPAAHYHMGGVAVDAEGRTSLPGLWAVGEVSASGLHGANRLASNSLLEGLVFGPRAARSIAHSAPSFALASSSNGRGDLPAPVAGDRRALPAETVLGVRTILWEKVGLVRDEAGLESALEEIDAIESESAGLPAPSRNLLLVARLIVHAALIRRESLGSHFRSDYPARAKGPPRHSLLSFGHDGNGGISATLEDGASTSPAPPARRRHASTE